MNAIWNALARLVTAFIFGPLDYAICRIHHRHP